MSELLKGRFTGMRPLRLDKVIQQFLSRNNEPPVGLAQIHAWITSGMVFIDGAPTRNTEKLIQPGSFVTVKEQIP